MAIHDVAGEWVINIMYEIFFVNFWVIILCAVFTLKPKKHNNLKKLKT